MMLRRYRLKVTEIVEAMKVDHQNYERLAEWCSGIILKMGHSVEGIMVPTLDGAQPAYISHGDYVVKNGTFKVMSAAEFEERYEPLS